MTTAISTPPQTPARSAKHVGALDGIRGIAILLVLSVHGLWFFRTYPEAWYFLPAQTGWSGVDLFFVLSGFLITGILLRTKSAADRAQSFYMRRILRIFPLYYGVLLALFIGVHCSWSLRAEFPGHNWRGWLIYVAYLQNWAFLHNRTFWFHNIIGYFWSLAVEEQFYLVWPWIVWAISPRAIVRLCIAGMLASLAIRVLLMWHLGPSNWVYEFALTPARGEGLLMGSALAALSAERKSIPRKLLVSMAGLGIAIFIAILLKDPRGMMSVTASIYTLTIGITAFNLIYGALVGSSLYWIPYLTPALNWGWLRSFGRYSYGMYVYHAPLFLLSMHFVQRAGFAPTMRTRCAIPFLLVNIGIVYTVAWLSFRYFESYFLRMKDRFQPRRSATSHYRIEHPAQQ